MIDQLGRLGYTAHHEFTGMPETLLYRRGRTHPIFREQQICIQENLHICNEFTTATSTTQRPQCPIWSELAADIFGDTHHTTTNCKPGL